MKVITHDQGRHTNPVFNGFKCPICGQNEQWKNLGEVDTINPPTYKTKCPSCGAEGRRRVDAKPPEAPPKAAIEEIEATLRVSEKAVKMAEEAMGLEEEASDGDDN